MDIVSSIIRYETGVMDEDEVVALFQALIDNGTVWHLQGSYGRTAVSLIEAGYCNATPEIAEHFCYGGAS